MTNANTQNTGATPASTSLFNKVVAVITALSLIFLQTPLSGFSSQALADATDAAAEQLAANTAVDVPLTFEHAYLVYEGQTVGEPATHVTIPGGAAMEFSVAADAGYQIEAVTAVINGTETELAPDGAGIYRLTAADVATTSNVTVRAITAPTVEDVVVEEPAAAEPEAAADADAADEQAQTAEGEAANADASASAAAASASAASPAANTRTEFTYEDDDVTVTAKLSSVDAVPANATFQVKPVTATTQGYDYDAYFGALNDAAAEGVEYTAANTLLYDISFMVPKTDANGKEIAGELVEYEPQAGTVAITITFKKAQLADALAAADATDVEVIHLPLTDKARDAVDSTEKATDLAASDIVVESAQQVSASVADEKTSFTLNSLSVTAVTTAGANGATSTAASTDLATTTLTTASAGTRTSTDLAEFLTNAVITAPTNSDGEYIIVPDTLYKVALTFSENTGLQFPNDGSTMTYTLPSGLDAVDGAEGSLTIKVNDGGTIISIPDNTYRIENGVLYFNFNTSDPNFPALAAANNAKFSMAFDGSFSRGASTILFSDGISRDLEVDTSTNVTVSKSSAVSRSSEIVEYTLTVRSDGKSENVVVTDTMQSGILSFKTNSFTFTSSTGRTLPTNVQFNGNTFTYSIPEMSDGEIITIKYRAQIDVASIPNNNGKRVTVQNNQVKVESDTDPTPGTTSIQTTIDYTPSIDKSDPTLVSENGDVKTFSWTITANEKTKVSMAGGTISDRISSASTSFMTYSGSGITVKVYDASDNLVRTDNIAWANLTSKTDSTWTYTVPQSDAGHAYKYVITYTTEADLSSKTEMATVANEATTDGGKSSRGEGEYMPAGGEVRIAKAATKVDLSNKEISWKVTFNVPETGLSVASVKDNMPKLYAANQWIFEGLVPGSLSVDGLLPGETYSLHDHSYEGDGNSSDSNYFRVTFYKSSSHTDENAGLLAGEARTITITYKTTISDLWVEQVAAGGGDWMKYHENNVKLYANEDTKKTSAKATVEGPSLKKSVTTHWGTRDINGTKVPVYRYELVLSNVTTDNLVIDDTFDTSLFELYVPEYTDDAYYIYGGDTYYQGNKGGQFSYTFTSDGIQITTNEGVMPHNANSTTGYYDSYKLVYYLAVKDATALNTITSRAAADENGTYKVTNTATWGDKGDSADVEFHYQGLNKELLTPDSELTKTDDDIWAEFRITLNPSSQLLNGGADLVMTDTFTNLSIDYSSIKAEPSEGVTWDVSGNTATYNIPDGTKVVITYKARVIFDSNGASGETKHVTFSNKAEMKGYSSDLTKNAARHNSGEGSASVPVIKLFKYEAGNMTNKLAGAKYELLDADKRNVYDKNGQKVTFTTDASGMITVRGDMENLGWALEDYNPNTDAGTTKGQYYLREVVAPVGYSLATFDYAFRVTSDGTTNYSQYIYHTGDTMSAKDYSGTDVQVAKEWTNGNEKHESDTITVRLQQKRSDGDWSDTIRWQNPNANYAWEDTELTLELSAANDWAGAFYGLPLEVPIDLADTSGDDALVEYRVVEVAVNGAAPEEGSVTITGSKEGGTYVYTVTNEFEELNGSLKVKKSLTDNGGAQLSDAAKSAMAGTYTFGIFTDEACETPYEVDGVAQTVSLTVGADGAEAVSDEVTDLPAADYWLKETVSSNAYAPVVNPVKVTVEAGKTGEEAAIASFTNNYASGSITFTGHKSIDTRQLNGNETYSFEVLEGSQKVCSADSDANGNITFPAINYTLADLGEHTYTVHETSTNGNGITIDTTSYTVKVNVSLGANGALVVAKDANAPALNFTNTYTAAGDITFEGAKSIDGRAITDDDEFDFSITEDSWTKANGTTVAGTHTYAAHSKGATISYPKIEYTLADVGTHTYTVAETSQSTETMKSDTRQYTVIVKVSDKGDGTLKVEQAEGSADFTALDFTNTYSAKGSTTFAGTKSIDGRDMTAADVFTFEIAEDDWTNAAGATVAGKTYTAQNRGATIEYPTINYTLADVGEHTYHVTETSADGNGVTVAASSYDVTVVVSDNGDGTLDVAASNNATALNFVNTYRASTSAQLKALKTLNGDAPEADAYSFTLTGHNVGSNGTETVKNSGNGEVVFSDIEFDQSDLGHKYTYTITEVAGSEAGQTYDTSQKKAWIEITLGENGALVPVVTYDGDGNPPTFENTSVTKLPLGGTKTLENRAFNGNESITFTVTGSEGAPMPATTSTTVKPAANAKTADFSFGDITFTNEHVGHTYIYSIAESANLAGVANDSKTHTVSVEVTCDKGVIIATPTYSDGEAVSFTNTYSATGSVTFAGAKSIDGRALTASDVFTFQVTEAGTDNEWNVSNDANGKIKYPTINYTLADVGTHTYHIAETSTGANGITVATNSYDVTVNVTDNGDGTLNVEASDNASALNFVNTYKATGDITFEGTKSLKYRDLTDGDVFEFSIVEDTWTNTAGETFAGAKSYTAKSDKTGKIDYPTIEYGVGDAGTHVYTVTETTTDSDTITVATNSYQVSVKVEDGGNGKLVITPSGDNYKKLDFENTYKATGSITLEGTKTLTGRDMKAGEFTFAVLEGDTVVAEGRNVAAGNGVAGAIEFDTITYKAEDIGTHTYTVKETTPSGNGIQASTAQFTVIVDVADNGDGTLTATKRASASPVAFVNTFTTSTDATLQARKTVNGATASAKDQGKFTFHATGQYIDEYLEASNDADGNVVFSPIHYTTADAGKTYTYTITEVVTDPITGMTYDSAEHTATVTINIDGEGNLTPAITYDNGGKTLVVNNTYVAHGETTFAGTKSIDTRDLLEGETYSFSIVEDDWTNAAGETVKGKAFTAKSDATGAISYPKIEYSLADEGDHTYHITETSTGGNGVTPSGQSYTVKLRVADNGNGEMVVTTLDGTPQALNFVNTYQATGDVTFTGKKSVDTRDLLEGETYTFSIVEDAWVNAKDETVEGKTFEATSDGTGKIAYPTISYTLADVGTHTYHVTESATARAGVTKAADDYEVVVTVSDNGNGTLNVVATDNAKALNFQNGYQATGDVTFEGTKSIAGRTMTDADVFSFEVAETSWKKLDSTTVAGTYSETVQNIGSKIDYPTISYTMADLGTHTYTVKETSTDGNGITVDGQTYTVEVTVTDNGDGTLNVVATDNAKALNFQNGYTANGELPFSATKTFDGAPAAGYTFTLSGGNLAAPVTATSGDDGVASFGAVQYTLADNGKDYTYTIRENIPEGAERQGETDVYKLGGYLYDGHVATITVHVADDGQGTMVATPTATEGSTSFDNSYETSGSITLTATKTVGGTAIEAGAYEFELAGADDGVSQTKTNDANGAVTFDAIEYDTAGTYHYTVSEKAGNAAGYTYDTAVYEVTVVVEDNGDGTMTATPTYMKTKDGRTTNARAISFNNTYVATGEITFEGTKSIDGRAMTSADVFKFKVTEVDANGANIPDTSSTIVTNAAPSGAIAYPTISYELNSRHDQTGLHYYQVREVLENTAKGITYDGRLYTVIVNVTDNGDGTLKVEKVEGSADYTALNFVNTYKATGNVTFEGSKSIDKRALTATDVFSFEVAEVGTDKTWTVSNDATGKIAYPTISYTLDDVSAHTYRVTESATDIDGVTAATTSYDVTVNVSDNGDGTLKVEKSDNATALDFVNNYTAAGSVTFAGTKSIDTRDLLKGETYSFTITEDSWKKADNTIAAGTYSATATSDDTGTIAYPTIEYGIDDLGEHTYTVKEVKKDGRGITTDVAAYTVKVSVSDKGDGTLKVEKSNNASALNFENSYTASGAITFTGTKKLTGRDMKAGEFSFAILEDGKVVAEGKNTAAKNGEESAIAFDPITYGIGDVRTHHYTVVETTQAGNGITPDGTVFTAEVVVTDNGDGTLTATKNVNDTPIAFVNDYTTSTDITLAAHKTVNGSAIDSDDAGVYTFRVTGPKIDGYLEAAVDGLGEATFAPIGFTTADAGKSFEYQIFEVAGTNPGMTYDTTPRKATVKVTSDSEGKLSTEVVYEGGARPVINNTYQATGDITFEGAKSIDTRALTDNDVFTFEVAEVGTSKTWSVSNDATGKINYPKITYTLADVGEHTYQVRETSTDGKGITVATNSYDVTVNVTDNGDGTLNVVASDNARALNFVNGYQAIGDVTFTGAKSVDTRDLLEGETYTFAIEETSFVNADNEQGAVAEARTATSDGTGKIAYPTISYTLADVGTHTYHVTESATDRAGVTKAADDYEVVVTVSDNHDGTLKVEKSANATVLNFVNGYQATGSVTFEGAKSIDTRDLLEGETYSFAIEETSFVNADNEQGAVAEARTATSDDTGTIAYPEIVYGIADVGTHTYHVTESATDRAGVTKAADDYEVVVAVTDNGDGTLNVVATDNAKALNFENTYTASGELPFSAMKTLNGAPAAGYTFTLSGGNLAEPVTATSGADGVASFGAVQYAIADAGKDYTYTIREVIPAGAERQGDTDFYKLDGYTYDGHAATITVHVTDNGDGTLTAAATETSGSTTFANTYEASGSITFTATKTVNNKAPKAGLFTFELVGTDDGVSQTKSNDANGAVAFDAITYDTAGTYHYTVSEKAGDAAGYTYDTAVYEATVVVIDNGDGTMTATPTYTKTVGEETTSVDAIAFANTYEASGDVTFEGTKRIDGRALTATDVFSFEVAEVGTDKTWTVSNDATGKIAYPTISYTLADVGAHTYRVTESATSIAGITKSAASYDVTVNVSDNGDGTLKVVTSDNATALDFTNTYEASGDVTFEGTKRIDGRALTATDTFSFEVAEVGTDKTWTVSNDATGKIAYPTISYTLADVGAHTYRVTESATSIAGITKSAASYDVTVNVSDNGDGTLKVVTSDNATALDFTNTYTASGELPFAGTKSIDGRDLTGDDTFTFEVAEVGTSKTWTAQNDASGKISYPTISYTLADVGEHTYTVTETSKGGKGLAENKTVKEVKVKVSDKGDGTLRVEVLSGVPQALNFTNTYTAAGSLNLTGTKSLTGRSMIDGEFSFEVTEGAKVVSTGSNDARGAIAFSTIDYTLADVGRHTYTVKEVPSKDSRIANDGEVYTFDVTVSDNGDGTLKVEKAADAPALAFTNTYTSSSEVSLQAQKTLNGRAPGADMFSFTLTGPKLPAEGITATNGTGGVVTFDPITFDQDDVGRSDLVYQIVENDVTDPTITKDTVVRTARVNVAINDEGNVEATAVYDNDALPAFANTSTTSISFAGTKTLVGRELTADDVFTFSVKEGGQQVATGASAVTAGGTTAAIEFTPIEYTAANVGTHTYTITENATGDDAIAASEAAYSVVVEVGYNADGTLKAEVVSGTPQALDFTNTYTATGSLPFAGTKSLAGRALVDGEFGFSVSEGGQAIANVKSDAQGTIAYPTIEYTLDDLGTHTYTVAETTTDGKGITVDTRTHTVIATVADNGDGTLKVTTEGSDPNALDFTNDYQASGSLDLAGTKTLTGRTMIAGEFTFEVLRGDEVVSTASNDADGVIAFQPLTFGLADVGKTYTYTVREATEGGSGLTVDDRVYTFDVAITDNGDGTLGVARTGDDPEALNFVNDYTTSDSIRLQAKKTVNGQAPGTRTFSFTLAGPHIPGGSEMVENNGENVQFGEITYTTADVGQTYEYTITEVAGPSNVGMTYDASVKRVSVAITAESDGTLVITPTYEGGAIPVFDNTYEASGSVTFAGAKSIDTRALTGDDVFTFEVAEVGTANTWSVSNGATGAIAYPTISYTLADVGTHTYTVKETSTGGNGITIDGRTYTVVVEVSDNGDGTLKVEKAEGSDDYTALNFVNTYEASGSVTFAGTKTLGGRDLKAADTFSFEVAEVGADNTWTAKSGSNGAIAYPTIEYGIGDVGTHTYTVKESATDIAGVAIDGRTYTVTVEVSDNGDGTLDVAASDNAEALNFTNTYTASADVAFVAMKTLDGRTLGPAEFTFALSEGEKLISEAVNNGAGEVRFAPLHFTLADVGTHTYTLSEVVGDLRGVVYDSATHPVTVSVSDNGDGTLGVAVGGAQLTAVDGVYTVNSGATFANDYIPEGSVELKATKSLTGATLGEGDFTFQLADAQGTVYATATNAADGTVEFPALTFKAPGTYVYYISEVVPEGAQTLGPNTVAGDVAYDTHSVKVTIEAIDNFNGTLNCTTTYEGGAAEFVNTPVPEATFPLSAVKHIAGRDFRAGDSFTFSVSADNENAPLPERTSVTLLATGGNDVAVDFGDITFTTADLGKTYTYTVSEQRAGETVDGLQFDPFAHWVKLTVNDAGDGTMRVDAQYQNGADAMTFTNTYTAEAEAVLHASKTLTGRAMAEGEFFFELRGADEASAATLPGGVEVLHASNAADGAVDFTPITFTQDDAGKSFTYTITETTGTLGGITYDSTSYDVVVTVADNGNGSLSVSYDYGATGAAVFHNEYKTEPTSATLEAHKMLVGGTLEAGQFSFVLAGVSANALGTMQTATNDADGLVSFETIAYDAPGVYEYRVNEVLPTGATDNGDGTFTSADGIVYDGTVHTAVVTVTDNGYGKLIADVAYDENAAGISFGNTALARTGLTFDKYFFGGVGTFDFKLTAVDASGTPRVGTAADWSSEVSVIDDGTSAFTITVQNGAYTDGVAKVTFPEIGYTADGDYYYLVEEAESSNATMIADKAQYLVHVVVADGAVASTTYELIYEGVNYGATDDHSFYNNMAVKIGFNSLSTQSYSDEAQRVSVYPKAVKYLNGSTDQLVGGEFTFELIDQASGSTIALATNDESGNVAFFDENTDPGLAYDEPGTYYYLMREVAGDEADMTYDTSTILVTVDVVQADQGLAASVSYNGPGGSEPAFYNVKEGMDIAVYKVSRFGGEGLDNCTYALWMAGENGDVMIAEATSDETGLIVFHDVALMAGQKYFFKEVEAPKGHTVDPYRTAYFSLNEDGSALVLVEDTASDGWHSANENIEIDNGVS